MLFVDVVSVFEPITNTGWWPLLTQDTAPSAVPYTAILLGAGCHAAQCLPHRLHSFRAEISLLYGLQQQGEAYLLPALPFVQSRLLLNRPID